MLHNDHRAGKLITFRRRTRKGIPQTLGQFGLPKDYYQMVIEARDVISKESGMG